jgi:two-component sensor histidine kinase
MSDVSQAEESFTGRIMALANANDLLTGDDGPAPSW